MKSFLNIFQKTDPSDKIDGNPPRSSAWTLFIEENKKKTAAWLTRRSERYSIRTKKIALIFFGIIAGGLCLFLVISPFVHELNEALPLPPAIEPFPLPERYYDANEISDQDFGIILGFRQTLDSLHRYDPVSYSSIVAERKGLVDTLDFLIRLKRRNP